MWSLTKAATAALAASAALLHVQAAVQLPAIFSSGMVLQSHASYGQRPILFGQADPNEVVTVNLTIGGGAPTTYQAVANATTGKWSLELNANDAATDVTLTIEGSSAPGNTTTIRNAAYGDVFLCGGQSNMDMSVVATFDGPEIANMSWPMIRLFSVVKASATSPQTQLPSNTTRGSYCDWYDNPPNGPDNHLCQVWQVAEPGVTGFMSAVCFYTAMYLVKSGAVPPGRTIGLIHSSYSGTAMELWAQQDVIDKCSVYPHEDRQAAIQAEAAAEVARLQAAGREVGLTAGPTGNSSLFNAMINPIAGYAIRSLIWNQGESNGGQPFLYFSCLFQGLIESWRRLWRIGDFAWLYVQLGDQEFSSADWPNYGVATPRDAQSSALPGHGMTDTTGMVAAYDLGDRSSPYAPAHVHARNKTEIGRRMALLVQHVQQGLQWPAGGWPLPNGTLPVDWSGPWPTALTSNGDGSFTVTFATLTGQGILMAPTHDCWECCAAQDTFQFLTTNSKGQQEWVNATANLVAGSPATQVKLVPVTAGTYATVRYAPSLWPQCAVFSVSNLIPAHTFSALNVTSSATVVEVEQQEEARSSLRGTLAKPIAALAQAEAAAEEEEDLEEVWGVWKGKTIARPSRRSGIIAATPPMGFNSWNSYHCNVDDNLIRKVGDAFISTGLAAAGYKYVNIDDCWQVDRAADGTINPDPTRFPYGMKPIADYLHGLGLNFGVYTAQGSRTCQNRPGAYEHEAQDAATYCSWGLDYLKIDLCGGTMRPVLNTSWSIFHDAFAQCVAKGGRPIVESIEYCSDPSPSGCGPWIGDVANVWRTTPDIQATFASVLANLDGNNAMAQWTKPGNWADPDMLQIGNPGLSIEESKTHFTAWCIVAAPLLIGADIVSGLDQAYITILTAPEVIAVNQDTLGIQGIRVSPANASGTECWAKPLADGSIAAMLLNRGTQATTAVCTWVELGLPQPNGAADVRDLWARADLGSFTGQYAATVPSHGVVMVKVKQ